MHDTDGQSYTRFFRQATRDPMAAPDGVDPYPYQERLATMAEWPDVLRVPTGAGKTRAVALAWLWRRRFHEEAEVRRDTPRRLVYTLPMRTLVEQTESVIRECLRNLGLAVGEAQNDGQGEAIGVHVVTGGDADDAWALSPEREAILIGTQDMLLSRALNRGYAQSRFAWPLHYGPLNGDVLWVADEVQLMGSALATTVQLDHFRRALGTVGPARTLWMSATLDEESLITVDSRRRPMMMELGPGDQEHPILRPRLRAAKQLHELDVAAGEPRSLAQRLAGLHQRGTRTLVVSNTVDRARELFRALQVELRRGGDGAPRPDLLLIHGRFRPAERAALNRRVMAAVDPGGPGVMVVATQVVEAGVDISARVLVTELAPWASLVQRVGRCNRYGEYDEGTVYWLDLPDKRQAPPYDEAAMGAARGELRRREGSSVSAEALAAAEDSAPRVQHGGRHVLRRRDLLDLFDTMPDLAGADIDIGRFVRDGDERDVHVFWRDLPADGDGWWAGLPKPRAEELCPAPLEDARKLADRLRAAEAQQRLYHWDFLERRWVRLTSNELRPGLVVLARRGAGAYDETLGWDLAGTAPVRVVEASGREAQLPEEGTDDDLHSASDTTPGDPRQRGDGWQTLAGHTADVVARMNELLARLPEADALAGRELREAARVHDWGKSHPCFQRMLVATQDGDGGDAARVEAILGRPPEELLPASGVWGEEIPIGVRWLAKSPHQRGRHVRPRFRHELASALALLGTPWALPDDMDGERRDLVAYLVAAHHGKARVGLRALPDEQEPQWPPRAFALGVWEGDRLPEVRLADGTVLPPATLSLEAVRMGEGAGGQPSWLERVLRLRDAAGWGPFRLAYLEALLRAADVRASMNPTFFADIPGEV